MLPPVSLTRHRLSESASPGGIGNNHLFFGSTSNAVLLRVSDFARRRHDLRKLNDNRGRLLAN